MIEVDFDGRVTQRDVGAGPRRRKIRLVTTLGGALLGAVAVVGVLVSNTNSTDMLSVRAYATDAPSSKQPTLSQLHGLGQIDVVRGLHLTTARPVVVASDKYVWVTVRLTNTTSAPIPMGTGRILTSLDSVLTDATGGVVGGSVTVPQTLPGGYYPPIKPGATRRWRVLVVPAGGGVAVRPLPPGKYLLWAELPRPNAQAPGERVAGPVAIAVR